MPGVPPARPRPRKTAPRRRTPARARLAATPPTPLTPTLATEQVAISDTRRVGGIAAPFVPYNPDTLASRRGGLRIYDDMLVDEQVGACLLLTAAAVLGPGWALDPADEEDAASVALADQVRDDLERLPGPLEDALSALVIPARAYGFAISELDWERDGARLRLSAIRSIAPHDWDFIEDAFGTVVACKQRTTTGAEFPPAKFVHFVNDPRFGNPYGHSDLRRAYRAFWHKTNWVQWMAIYGEKLADAPIVSKHPSGTAPERVSEAQEVLANLQARTVLSVPGDWDVSTLTDGREPRSTFLEAIEHYDRQIAKALLVPDKMGLVGGEVKGGSYSLGQTQFDVFLFHLTLLQRRLVTCVQEQVIARMAEFAGAGDVPAPRFRLLPMTAENVEQLGRLWLDAVNAKAQVQTLKDINRFRELCKFTPITEEELEALKPEPVAPEGDGGGDGNAPADDGTKPDAPPADDETVDDDTEGRVAAAVRAVEPQKRSLFIALWMEPEEASALALTATDAEPAEELHVTLCYCPEVSEAHAAIAAVAAVAQSATALRGEVGGVGRFQASATSDGKDVIYAVPDVPGLTALREQIASAIAAAGVEISGAHGFTPHITLAYVPAGADSPAPSLPRLPIALRRLVVKYAGETVLSLDLPDSRVAAAVPVPATAKPVPTAFWRQPRPNEARADLAAMRDRVETQTTALADALATGAEQLVADVRKRATKLLRDLDPNAVRDLGVSASTLATARKAVQAALTQAYDTSRTAARAELRAAVSDAKAAKLAATTPGLVGTAAERFFRAKAFWITGILEQDVLSRAQAVLFNAVKGDKLPRHVEAELDEALRDYVPVRDKAGRLVNVPARIENIARTNLMEATNEARYAVFADPDVADMVEGLQYSAILDDRTREEHAAWDGIVKPVEWWLGPPDRRPPNSWNCRCMLVPVTIADDEEITPDADLPSEQVTDPGFR